MSATIEPLEDHEPSPSARTEGTESTTEFACCEELMTSGSKPMEMCPMAGMCKGMMKTGVWGGLLFLPPVFLVAGGLLVILVPEVLAWLLGGAAIVMGVMFFFMAAWMRRLMTDSSRRTTVPRLRPTP